MTDKNSIAALQKERLKTGAVLAPMAGVTDMPFRLLCMEMGCAFAYTEMLSAKGFLMSARENRNQKFILAMAPQEKGKVILQIFGHEPEAIREAADQLTASGAFCGLDINMGCPMPKITGHGDGSALLKDPGRAREVMQAAVEASHVPVSVKLRLGWDEGDAAYLPIGRMAEECGVTMLMLHARTRAQLYGGKADWDAIARLKKETDLPVIGNGDVTTAQDALRMLEQTGCDGVAVGRGAQGNPWVFRDIQDVLCGRTIRPIPPQELLQVMLRHLAMLSELKGEHTAVCEMRQHASFYIRGMRGAAQVRQRINAIQTEEAFTELMTAYMTGRL